MPPNVSDCAVAQDAKLSTGTTTTAIATATSIKHDNGTNLMTTAPGIIADDNNNVTKEQLATSESKEQTIVWRNVIIIAYAHIAGIFGMWHLFVVTGYPTFIFALLTGYSGAFGITAGAHRLWAHKSYKAKLPLRIMLMFFQTLAFQNCIYDWARDHRAHHKYTDTDADPHNSRRGFFYSHVGWLMMKKHTATKSKVKNIDMEDLKADPVVMWQKRNYGWFMPLATFFGPALICWYCFDETWWNAWNSSLARWVLSVNITWLLNSAAHMWGWRPYDKNHSSTDTALLGWLCFGEGWHNYHHVFPWDYKTSELVHYHFNFTNAFIDLFAKIGWAYDLKTVGNDMIKHRVLRTGDGSHPLSKKQKRDEDLKKQLIEYVNRYQADNLNLVWGWDDKDMPKEDKEYVTIYNKKD